MNILVEVVACTAEDAVQPVAAGAHRIELVSAISEGGLTPSVGALRETNASCHLPVMVMIRPRGGGFVYTESEFRTMQRDIEALAEEGADGFVLGILTSDGELDVDRLAKVVRLAGNLPVVCHRAFDLVADSDRALEQLIDLGFRRILSNGQASDAAAGEPRLRQMSIAAAKRIEILPGGGVRSSNVAEIVRETGTDQVHLGPFTPCIDPWSGDAIGSMAQHLKLNPDEVRDVIAALTALP